MDRILLTCKAEVWVHSVDFAFDHQPVPVLFGNKLSRLTQRPPLTGESVRECSNVTFASSGPRENDGKVSENQLAVQFSEFRIGGRREALGVAKERVMG